MDRDTTVSLDQVHDGIENAIRSQFPDLHVEFYREDRKGLPLPACLLEMTDMEGAPDHDPGTEQLAVTVTFEALLVMSFRQADKNAKREVRKLAGALAAFARLQRWGCPIGPAEVVGAYPDNFEPELDQFECWRVEWRQVVHLGETVWNNDGIPPAAVFLGIAPNIGAAHKDDYFQIAGLPNV